MDPEILLDYALFQLTPTRTRCDLVVFSGAISEKLASGLVEPFVSHLKFAKDQFKKGGYSITLRPPTTDASWFTKATFQRLVRFISTPEILERFVRIEQEILQIESSVQSKKLLNTNIAANGDEGSLQAADGITNKSNDSSKFKGEIGGANDVTQEENSKIRLQRLLETRKALLRKEQAMAYARALVTGFEMDNMGDLILFADTFGASRLREACTDFKELCKKKRTDGLWMDELAAMAACSPAELSYSGTSGIILACESNASSQNNMLNFHSNLVSSGTLLPNGSLDASSDSTASQENLEGNKDKNLPASDQSTPPKVHMQMPWPNQIPQYMYNFQSPVQKIPQFQGYPFPYYPGHMHWPPNMDDSSHHRRHHKSSSRKMGKSPNVKEPETSEEEEEQIQSSESDSGSGSDAVTNHDKPILKKHRKKSSKTVVIRNINYITSKRRNGEKDGDTDEDSSSFEDELIDEDSLKQKVDDAVGSLEKHHKSKSRNNNKKRGAHKDLENGGHNESWDALQNLLLKDEDSTTNGEKEQQTINVQEEHFTTRSLENAVSFAISHAIDLKHEKVPMQRTTTADSFVVIERNGGNEGKVSLEDITEGESIRPGMKIHDSSDGQLLISGGLEESESNVLRTLSDFVPESSTIKNRKGEDWFIVNHSGISENKEITIEQSTFDGSIEGDRFNPQTSKKIADPIDDSFMVQARSTADDQYDSQWRTDISMVADLVVPSQHENGTPDVPQVKLGLPRAHEPDDLCMMLVRDSSGSVEAFVTTKIDYGSEIPFTKADKKSAPVESNDHTEEKLPINSKSTNIKKDVGKEAKSNVLQGSIAKSKSNYLSKSKKASPISRTMVQKSKLEKEEETRKRMEELLIERQKRIAERSAASGCTPAASKRTPIGSKMAFCANLEPKKLSSPKVGATKATKGQAEHK